MADRDELLPKTNLYLIRHAQAVVNVNGHVVRVAPRIHPSSGDAHARW